MPMNRGPGCDDRTRRPKKVREGRSLAAVCVWWRVWGVFWAPWGVVGRKDRSERSKRSYDPLPTTLPLPLPCRHPRRAPPVWRTCHAATTTTTHTLTHIHTTPRDLCPRRVTGSYLPLHCELAGYELRLLVEQEVVGDGEPLVGGIDHLRPEHHVRDVRQPRERRAGAARPGTRRGARAPRSSIAVGRRRRLGGAEVGGEHGKAVEGRGARGKTGGALGANDRAGGRESAGFHGEGVASRLRSIQNQFQFDILTIFTSTRHQPTTCNRHLSYIPHSHQWPPLPGNLTPSSTRFCAGPPSQSCRLPRYTMQYVLAVADSLAAERSRGGRGRGGGRRRQWRQRV